jgi:hypothetical protein
MDSGRGIVHRRRSLPGLCAAITAWPNYAMVAGFSHTGTYGTKHTIAS